MKTKVKKDKIQARYDRSRFIVRIMAAILALIMVFAVAASVIFALMR